MGGQILKQKSVLMGGVSLLVGGALYLGYNWRSKPKPPLIDPQQRSTEAAIRTIITILENSLKLMHAGYSHDQVMRELEIADSVIVNDFDRKVQNSVERYLERKERESQMNSSQDIQRESLLESVQQLLDELMQNKDQPKQHQIPERRLDKVERDLRQLIQNQAQLKENIYNPEVLQSRIVDTVLEKMETIRNDLMDIYRDLQRQQRGNFKFKLPKEKSNYCMSITLDLENRINALESQIQHLEQQDTKSK